MKDRQFVERTIRETCEGSRIWWETAHSNNHVSHCFTSPLEVGEFVAVFMFTPPIGIKEVGLLQTFDNEGKWFGIVPEATTIDAFQIIDLAEAQNFSKGTLSRPVQLPDPICSMMNWSINEKHKIRFDESPAVA